MARILAQRLLSAARNSSSTILRSGKRHGSADRLSGSARNQHSVAASADKHRLARAEAKTMISPNGMFSSTRTSVGINISAMQAGIRTRTSPNPAVVCQAYSYTTSTLTTSSPDSAAENGSPNSGSSTSLVMCVDEDDNESLPT